MPSATASPAPPDPGGGPGAALAAALDRLAPDGPLGVALSGGGDSAALLLLAARWARARGRRLEAATVDHRLRPESAAEAAEAGRLAARLGASHAVLPWAQSPGRGNLQAAARAARRRLLAGWARERGLAAILTGHTRDDVAETFLMRLARGAGVDGLSAMPERFEAEGALWLRPLLGVGRAALREVLRAEGVGWAEDPTNEDPRFDRTRARAALACLAPLGIDADALARTAERLSGQRRVLESAAARLAAEARRWGPLGDARIAAGPLAAAEADTALRLLADTLARLSGARGGYPPRREALARVAAGGAGTLAGVAYAPEEGGLRLWREPAAAAPPVPLAEGAVWDGRWRVLEAGGLEGATLGVLGEAGAAALRAEPGWAPPPAWGDAPPGLRAVQPAIRRAGRLLAAPTLGHRAPEAARLALEDRASQPPDSARSSQDLP